ncbi:MAG: hypothetical protein LUI13_07895 [Lachnospiraceae bacterium]|nr:hypothetical protein [Lachnospiraceae bacterium]
MIYHFRVPGALAKSGRLLLQMGEYRGTLIKIRINGKPAANLVGNAFGRPDLTEYLNLPMNDLEIEVVGSPRNMMGPFHQAYTGCSRISWEDFRTEGRFHCDDYVLEPYGLMGQIAIVVSSVMD